MHVFPSIAQAMSPSDHEDENDPDGPFAFRRRKACNYYAVSEFSLGASCWRAFGMLADGDGVLLSILLTLCAPFLMGEIVHSARR